MNRITRILLLLLLAMGALIGCTAPAPPEPEQLSWRYSPAQLRQAAEAGKNHSRREYVQVGLMLGRAAALCQGVAARDDCSQIVIEALRPDKRKDAVVQPVFRLFTREGKETLTLADDPKGNDLYSLTAITEINRMAGVEGD
jgi:hypothetical protein